MSLEKIVSAIQQNRYFNAVKTAIIKVAYINITLAVILFVWVQFQRFMDVSEDIRVILILVYQYYCIMMGLIFSYIVADQLSLQKENEPLKYATVFLAAILAVVYIPNNFTTEYPIVALFFSPIIYFFLDKLATLKVGFEKVPQAVADYYNCIMPVLVMTFVILILIFVFDGGLLWVGNVLATLTRALASPLAVIIVTLAICSFWVMGVHGVAVIGTIMRPFWFYMMLVNGYLVLLGQPAFYIGSETFFQWVVWLGGSGCTLGLSLCMRYFAKSIHLRTLGSEVMTSNWFNINENVIFGVPIVENRHFRFPFFMAPLICALVGYSAFAFGYVSVPAIVSPWVLPAPIGIFISTLGDYRSLILIALLIVISAVIYYPFFKRYDNELRIEEMN
ncbi:PTS sugar transporter subunit IIC [Erysipelothrix sp. HDW6C]|uniref:PTS transporter subunit EIIC n=1 Tax=Erysipelothrix sp. HDW6C TaxID=2714930 RepID=UPI0014083BE1|nr:PTS transporter subunit EIIC [Erysipelothrix sp. HDW6C]QIK70019.1 PTS sugar transporter subunit IIC [Erysipelothrix sp. HDW6C]